ncbi:MAG: caspase, EACC1-associated type [Waterburya sp.]
MIKVALLVGVSEYKPGFNSLPSAIQDIQAMKKVLEEKGEFEVTTLPNPEPQAMQLAIDQLFANRTSEDLVLFYFSGHGIKDYKRKFYLTTSETTKDQQRIIIPPTAVAASYLQSQMTDSRSERQVIILDCCYSGAIAQGLTVKGEVEIDIQAELGGKGRAILTSSSSTQESYTQENSELSIYTHYLIEGLETGTADFDEDGKISVEELHEYTKKKVQEASPAMTPQFYPVEEGYKIYLARSPIDDPKLKYRKKVERIIEEDEGEIDFITGEIDDLDRVYLNELGSNLSLSTEEARQIETEAMQPLRQRQQKLQRYREVFLKAIKKRFPLTSADYRKLKRIQELFGLRDEDVATIEGKSQPTSSPSLQVFQFDVLTIDAQGQETKRETKQAEYFTQILDDDISLEMVSIPGGSFMMGSPPEETNSYDGERPQHQVTVPSFYMGRYPITQAQWRVVALWEQVERKLDPDPSSFKEDYEGIDRWTRPVETISWEDAKEFCNRLSRKTKREYRLPTEAEWEYACRAVISDQSSVNSEELKVKEWNEKYNKPFHFGETISTELANYDGNYTYGEGVKGDFRGQTNPVGYFQVANNFGLCDMHGNVWEWCEDDWHNSYKNAPTDGSSWLLENSNFKVIRGGSWNFNPDICRSAYRNDNNRDFRYSYFGFRVMCVVFKTT